MDINDKIKELETRIKVLEDESKRNKKIKKIKIIITVIVYIILIVAIIFALLFYIQTYFKMFDGLL